MPRTHQDRAQAILSGDYSEVADLLDRVDRYMEQAKRTPEIFLEGWWNLPTYQREWVASNRAAHISRIAEDMYYRSALTEKMLCVRDVQVNALRAIFHAGRLSTPSHETESTIDGFVVAMNNVRGDLMQFMYRQDPPLVDRDIWDWEW